MSSRKTRIERTKGGRRDAVDLPDIGGAEGTIAEIQSALSLVNSMKSNCTEAKKNVDNVRESIGKIESTIREKLRDLRNQLKIS